MTFHSETLTIRNQKVHLLQGGAGPPLLYLHGLVADIHSLSADSGLTAFHEALAQSFTVYAPALPGYAETEGYDELETIEDMVFFCLDVLDALTIDTVHLVGTSLGGWVATELATRHARRLQKLVLINPLGISTPEARIGNFFYSVTPKAEGGNHEVRELIFSDQHSELALGAIPDNMSPESQLLFYKAQMVSARIGWTPPSLYNPRLKDRLFRVTTPTLLVSATGDRLVPTAIAEVYQAGLPEAEVVRVADAAHAVWLEHPQHTAEIVTRFLQHSAG